MIICLNLKRPSFNVLLNQRIGECSAQQPLEVVHGVLGVFDSQGFGFDAYQPVGFGEADVAGECSFPIGMLQDLYFVVVIDGHVGVAGTEVDSNGRTLIGLFRRY